jgi:hypothetical protein
MLYELSRTVLGDLSYKLYVLLPKFYSALQYW